MRAPLVRFPRCGIPTRARFGPLRASPSTHREWGARWRRRLWCARGLWPGVLRHLMGASLGPGASALWAAAVLRPHLVRAAGPFPRGGCGAMKPPWRVSAEPRPLPSLTAGARRGAEVKRRRPSPRRGGGGGPGTLPSPQGRRSLRRAAPDPARLCPAGRPRPRPGAGGARPLGRCCPGWRLRLLPRSAPLHSGTAGSRGKAVAVRTPWLVC